MARPAIFDQPKTTRIQGVITATGNKKFERARKSLGVLVGWPTARVSDADTIEYLARGHEATVKYLAQK